MAVGAHVRRLALLARRSDGSGIAAGADRADAQCPPIAVGAVTVISPLELIRTKMQSRQLSYQELRVCIQSAVAQDGWLSLWRGWGPTVLRDVPFSGMAGGHTRGEPWHWKMGG